MNQIDFGARAYDPRIGKWLSGDPLKREYTDLSPYQFCANSPISAIDPDGRVIIFINGMWDIPTAIRGGGTVNYWGQNWVSRVQNAIGDHKQPLYYDGSVGGFSNVRKNYKMSYRMDMGRIAGYRDAKSIIDKLDKDETIKLITNSMGAAFERGFTKGLFAYIENRKSEIDIEKLMLGFKKAELESKISPANLKILNLLANPNQLETQLLGINDKINQLNIEKQKLESVRVEMVIDLSSHQVDFPDHYAERNYYMTAEKLNLIEYQFVKEESINFSKFLGKMKRHHASWAEPQKFPRAQNAN